MSSTDVIIGKKIRLWRRARGLTTMQLGEKLSVSFSQIIKYENASNRISASRLYELAKILSIDVSDFFISQLTVASTEMDNVTHKNIKDLKQEARTMIECNQEAIDKFCTCFFLSSKLHPN